MIIKINGKLLDDKKQEITPAKQETFSWKVVKSEPKQTPPKDNSGITETLRDRFKRIVKPIMAPAVSGINLLAAYPVSAAANSFSIAGVAPAAAAPALGLAPALAPVISMLQDLALPVGIGMAIWGLIEIIIGNPGGKEKIKYSMLGYIGVFIVPFFFYQIRNAFGVIPIG